MSRHTGYPGGFPFGCWRGMIMEDDHDLDLQIFRNNPNCNWEVSSSYIKLQLPSAALSIPSSPSPHLPKVPSPKSRRPGSCGCRGAAGPRWSCTSSLVPTLFIFYADPQGQQAVRQACPTGVLLCPTGVLIDPVAAVLLKLINCSFVLRRLKLICSSPGVKSTCTLNSRVDLDSADGVRAHNVWMYCTR